MGATITPMLVESLELESTAGIVVDVDWVIVVLVAIVVVAVVVVIVVVVVVVALVLVEVMVITLVVEVAMEAVVVVVGVIVGPIKWVYICQDEGVVWLKKLVGQTRVINTVGLT